jgi:ABC-type sugar transport system ATPase subunit
MIYVTHDQTEAMTLADDIVVLDEGIVSQSGSPMEMYNNPKNIFVGGFIGSPKMNFISSKILSSSNNLTEVDLFGSSKISIPKTLSNASDGDKVQLGIRPEHLLINQDGDANWESKVFVVEKLGSGTFLYLEKDDEPLVVETEGDTNIQVGDTVKIGFTASRCHLFDKNHQAFN